MKKVLKFGGTSVGSASNMRQVASIIKGEGSTLTVLSAMSGTTDAFVTLQKDNRKPTLDFIRSKYSKCIDELLSDKLASYAKLESVLGIIETSNSDKEIVAQGELLTTFIFTQYLVESGVKAILLNAPDYMTTDVDGIVKMDKLKSIKGAIEDGVFYVTQGFICTNSDGEIDNLGRGGSDYSAALFGPAIGAGEVQIWTDIDGMHNGDPRFVDGTRPIKRMSFEEAAELAYFGAKILHPAAVLPCQEAGIDVRLKNTLDPTADGTLIGASDESAMNFHAVAAKDNITILRITSARMLMAYGFLRKVFEVFEKYKTPIDMITTSEVAVALTIDNTCALDDISRELSEFGTIEVETGNSIVCVVGRMDFDHSGLAVRIFKAVENVPIKMISYGASHRSMSLLINTSDKKATLQSLNNFLF